MLDHLFVYGTLRRAKSPAMRKFMQRHCRYVHDGEFYGKLFGLGEYPAAVVTGVEDERVVGEIHNMHNPEFLLKFLDVFEGCTDVLPLYKREKMKMRSKTGSEFSA